MSDRTALVLIDLQRDYLDHPLLSPEASLLCATVAELLARARAADWPVIHIHTRISPDGSDAMPHWQSSRTQRCVMGTAGAEPPEMLAALPGEPIIAKRFYSGFESGELAECLRGLGVNQLLLAGVHTHACVRQTAIDAYAHGFHVTIARDAVGSYDSAHAHLTLQWLEGRVAKSVAVAEILPPASASIHSKANSWAHRNPCNWNEVIDEIAISDAQSVASQAQRLRQCQPALDAMAVSERAALLHQWHDRLAARHDDWVALLARYVAKPFGDARGEVAYGLALVKYVADNLINEEPGLDSLVRYRPHGLVGLITPWNNPFAIAVGKIAPALGMGNAILWKPALPASALSRAIMESLAELGLDTWVGLAVGDVETGRAVANLDEVGAISFTGSIAAGRELALHMGRRLKPLQAELGGNNAAIIMADCDLAAVAQDLAQAMFSFSGQRCTAIRRLIVESSVVPIFREALVTAVENLRIGYPTDEATRIGPVISKPRQMALLEEISAAVQAGGRVLTGGFVPQHCDAEGNWIAPTIMEGLSPDMKLVQQEQFGPVVVMTEAKNLADAITLHNRVEHGLLGTIYTSDADAQQRFLSSAQAGLLLVNQARPAFSAAGPFLGWKSSGFGPPEHGRWNREAFAQAQAVYQHRSN